MKTLTEIIREDWNGIKTWSHLRGCLSMASRRLRALSYNDAADSFERALKKFAARTGRIPQETAKANLLLACQYLQEQGIED